ncbi:hypothetical protein [Pacificibacter sp. AS14]
MRFLFKVVEVGLLFDFSIQDSQNGNSSNNAKNDIAFGRVSASAVG